MEDGQALSQMRPLCQRLGLMGYVWDREGTLEQVLLGVDLLDGYEEHTC